LKDLHQEHRNIWKLQKFEQSAAQSPEGAPEIEMLRKFMETLKGCAIFQKDTQIPILQIQQESTDQSG
jgi:hypothetical protein